MQFRVNIKWQHRLEKRLVCVCSLRFGMNPASRQATTAAKPHWTDSNTEESATFCALKQTLSFFSFTNVSVISRDDFGAPASERRLWKAGGCLINIFLLAQLFKQNWRINFARSSASQEPSHMFTNHLFDCLMIMFYPRNHTVISTRGGWGE